MLTADQLIAAQKANLETLTGLTTKAFEGLEKLVELNVKATRAALSESSDNAQSLLNAKDAQELLALQAKLMQPLAEKATAYNRQLLEIAQGTGSALSQAVEAQAADAQKKIAGLVDNAAKNAPAGFESQVAVMKNAVSAATNAYESVQKAVKQASDVAQANLDAVTAQVVSAGKTAKKR
jgi:phasin family protein